MLLLVTAAGGPRAAAPREASAVFAGGCFWGVEWVFEHLRGVKSVVAGYSGGSTIAPAYEQVGTGTTGHAESVRVVYDPGIVSYRQLLEVFFLVAHDPTTRDRQGPDVGSDYRAIVFVRDSGERREGESFIAALAARRGFFLPLSPRAPGIRRPHRHRGAAGPAVLSRRVLSSALRRAASDRALHPHQRRPEARAEIGR